MTQQYARLTDSQWNEVKGFLPIKRKRKHDLRDVFDAILWVTRTGCQWRNLDRQFSPWQVVHNYFSKWSRDHTLETMNDALNRRERDMDGGKWVKGRKRSILADTLGRVWRVEVHAANVHDGVAGLDLIYPDFTGQLPRVEKSVADTAYTGQFAAMMQRLDRVGFECSLRDPQRRGFVVEPRRWVVERTFAWWNWYRRLIKDYERTV